MISCSPHPDGRRVEVTFTVADPERVDHRINLVGDFNDWDPAAGRMHNSAGTHTATVALHPGRYRFRYLSSHDGWFNDQDAGCYEFNEFGQRNCVLDLAVVDLAGLRRRAVALQDAR
jgi:hypothetical protein